ncbi:unannotated protein [freshwater metagenome]|uniref:Unannotated protein n=1 Tax=freshwater metagenome TaxID=449393 RepID=A0A6J7R994_9ZZZZ
MPRLSQGFFGRGPQPHEKQRLLSAPIRIRLSLGGRLEAEVFVGTLLFLLRPEESLGEELGAGNKWSGRPVT